MRKFPDAARQLAGERLGDLCGAAEAAWVAAVAGGNPIDRLGVEGQVAALKAELLGASPSLLEKVLVSVVVVARLAHHRAVAWAALPAPQPAVAAARDRRVESASRQLVSAVKALAVVRRQQARGASPRAGLTLFEAPD